MNKSPSSVQILVISLKRSLDRRMRVEQEMQKISTPWSFLDAIDGSSLRIAPAEYKINKVKILQGYALTPNEIGCYLSHKEAWKFCVKKNIPTLVLEDDFILCPEFESLLNSLLDKYEQWDFLRLQGLYEVPFSIMSTQPKFTLVKNHGDAVGATAYLLKPHIAAQLIKHSFDIYEPVDHFLEHHQKHHLEFLAIQPYPVNITHAKSTISDRSERPPVKGFRKFVRSIARLLDRRLSKQPWFPKY